MALRIEFCLLTGGSQVWPPRPATCALDKNTRWRSVHQLL